MAAVTDSAAESAASVCVEAKYDADGYPLTARRRLKRLSDEVVVDVDDGQQFRPRKIKGGFTRLVPIFKRRVDWKSSEGYAAMRLMISCMGAEGEYELWDEAAGKAMDVQTWTRQRYKTKNCPPVRHRVCGETVTTTQINHIHQRGGIGCSCYSNHANHWRGRRAEVVQWGAERGFEVVTTESEWIEQCTGAHWRPPLRCLECDETVTNTLISSLHQGRNIGCGCHLSILQHWRNRRFEIVECGKERGFEVLTTEEEWVEQCDGRDWHPTLRCLKCGETVTSSQIGHLKEGHNIGCPCHSDRANHWRGRRAKVVEWGVERGFEVMTTEEDWVQQCDGKGWKPTLRCLKCGETVTGTQINQLQQGHNIGCTCHSNRANHWRERRSEVVEWGVDRGFEVITTEEDWVQQCDGKSWKPTLRCLKCGETVTGTQINQLQQGSNVGCGCHLSILQHWRDRRAEVIEWGVKRGFEVITTEAEWVQWCAGIYWCPTLRCLNCGVVVKSATLNNLHQGHHIGCTCHSTHANHWRGRRAEVVQWGAERDFDVVTTDEEWVEQCRGCEWRPTLRCLKCEQTVTSTNITSLQQGQGLGCACRNKTEAKLQEWLTRSFPNAVVVPQSPGPKTDLNGQTRFDFLLRFSDEHAVFIELDGAQHFWKDAFRYNERRCGLDKLKEEWAVTERGRCVVRVLQDDVWCDKYDWQGWLVRSVASSRHGAPRVFTPSVPEYTSCASKYGLS